ncbi:WAS/WASL-interacting protein family member 1-like [Planococcus citri]|uniref:WAS/WASL-interacting protein family member 1-like n=1 Tax=Planococcus citri TaxID=170843 RepID=UPI0031F7C21B
METRVSILIVLLTIVTQLNGNGNSGGGYTSRYGFPSGIIKRVGSQPRPLLSAPSSVLTENVKTASDPPGGGLVISSMGPIIKRSNSIDEDAFHRRAAELESAFDQAVGRMKEGLGGLGGLGGSGGFGGFGGFGGLDNSGPGKSRVSVPISERPLPETPSYSGRPDYSSRPSPGIPILRPPPSRQPSITEPPAQPEAPTVPDQTSGYRRGPRFDRSFSFAPNSGFDDPTPPPTPPTPAPVQPPTTPDRPRFRIPSRPYVPPSAPESCASTDPDAQPSVSKYRRQESRKAPLNDSNDAPKEPEPYRAPSNTKRPSPSNPYKPSTFNSNEGSPRTDRFQGSAVVSDRLPNNSGTIDIRISGRQIDDERMLQMVKEAKNAITVVFFAPAYETEYRGSITFGDEAPQIPMKIFGF